MLAKSLDDAAQADGRCSSSAVVPCGELNRGWIMGIYEQPAQAAQSWLTAIRRFKFTNYTGLAWLGWRDAEGLWHKIWPESWPLDVDFNLLVSDAALQAIHDHWLALQEQMQQALRAAELADVLNGQS